MSHDVDEIIGLLKENFAVSMLEGKIAGLHGVEYCFMESTAFAEMLCSNIPQAMKIYWTEILSRAHLAAATSLFRTHRWLDGMRSALIHENYLAFAACFRGLIEAAADTDDGLASVPKRLVDEYLNIVLALEGRLDRPKSAKDLEDALLAYSHARSHKSPHPPPLEQRAKTAKAYITTFQGADTGPVHDCYAELCDITHPAAGSVMCFLDVKSPEKMMLTLTEDKSRIAELLVRHKDVITSTVMDALNIPFVILDLLARFPVASLHTPVVTEEFLDRLPLWREIRERLSKMCGLT